MPFKRGDVVVYVGRDPRRSDPEAIGSVGIVQKVESENNVMVDWWWWSEECPWWHSRWHSSSLYGVYSKNIEKLGEVDYDKILKGTEGTHSHRRTP